MYYKKQNKRVYSAKKNKRYISFNTLVLSI